MPSHAYERAQALKPDGQIERERTHVGRPLPRPNSCRECGDETFGRSLCHACQYDADHENEEG